ncbi:amidohydrolase family protein [Rhizobiaceae bacterium BDR2-2]|uniref:Amidohydrolase family protein n=1 Tax=Ectorhizobium quercum TaxID=2965071 RepID=A0AAE3MZ81_9HYPH|nr:amidohydrolase family protein [Ectorhizobium quercum]MCX8997077.1 amidohydrolase family protein [Ectorhizobium quercum]
MLFDLVIRNARTDGAETPVDIAVKDGLIAAIGPGLRCEAVEETDVAGAYAFGGFVDSHVHLDKACILDRCAMCEGTLAEAVRETAKAKTGFTAEDVHARAARVVEKAISHGTTRMRSFVEIDPRAGFRSFEALKRVKADYAFAIDIELCAFAQEGLTQEPETLAMLDRALAEGADLVGGCPYTDPDPARHVALIFDLAEKHDVAVDFHLDFDLDPNRTNLPAVIDETERRGWGGRVSIGHVTNLSAMPADAVDAIGHRLAAAGIALTVLPATDLFLNGRGAETLVPRGVAPAHRLAAAGVVTSIATNNVLNPFTPYGDASLIRMANLYANVVQLSRDDDMRLVFSMVSTAAAHLLRAPSGLAVGTEATVVLLDCPDPAAAVREVARVIGGWKRGRRSFWNGRMSLFPPRSQA